MTEWLLNGNAGTDPNHNFLGTTDNKALVIRTNNTEALRIDTSGRVGIGTKTPSAKLNVDPGGPGGITIGNPSTGQGGFTSLLLDISAESGGFATIQAIQSSGTAWGNIGINTNGGNVGIGTNTPQVKLDVAGDIHATGTKNFVQAHPTDPSKEIVYATLEGGEAGTYTRGTWKLDNGKAVIKLPEHFGLVTSEDGLTVQFTPRGEWLQLYVVKVNTGELVVQEAQGKSGQFDYLIQGVRKGYEHHEVIQERK